MSKETVNSPEGLDPRVKLAFDQRKYLGLTREEFLARYTQDLAALSQEASPLRSINYTPLNFSKLDDHTLVCPEYDSRRDVSSYNSYDGFFEVQCSFASEAVRDILLHTERDGLVIWISPSADPKHPLMSRLNLYLKHRGEAGNEIADCYSVTWCQSADYCLGLGNLIRVLSDQSHKPPFENINDLRQTAQFIPLDLRPGDNIWQQTSGTFPLPADIWADIISGRARVNFDAAKSVAQKRAEAVYVELNELGPDAPVYEYVRTGARSEAYMADSGHPIGDMSDCDFTNTSVMMGWKSPTAYFQPGVTPKEASCSEIKCAQCPWKPNNSQLAEISSGRLSCCPDCGWIPGTPVVTFTKPQIIFQASESELPSKKPVLEFKPSSTSTESFSFSWIDYYFLPWLADAFVSADSAA